MSHLFWQLVRAACLELAKDSDMMMDFRRALLAIMKAQTPEQFRVGLLQMARFVERRYPQSGKKNMKTPSESGSVLPALALDSRIGYNVTEEQWPG